MARECGANCVKKLTPWVTHLVAAKVNNIIDRRR
jgi:hypothetical protein